MPRALLPPLSLALALLGGMGPARAQDLIPRPDADPQLVLNEASNLARAGRYEEALQRQIWFRDNALRLNPAFSGVRQSFALSAWVDLGKKYPPAHQALVDARDRAVAACRGEAGTNLDFSDVASINGYLDEDDRTVALFRELDAEKPKLARSSIHYATAKLIEAGEYPLCAKYLPDFRSIRGVYEMSARKEEPNDQERMVRRALDDYFTRQTCELIEVLVGAGRKPEAEEIQAQAVAIRDVPALREAIATAERNVDQARAAAAAKSPRQKP